MMQDVAQGFQEFRTTKSFLRRLQGSVLLSPVVLVVLLSIFLFNTGQIREVLIRVVEMQNKNCHTQLTFGFVAFALLAITLYYNYLAACVLLRQTGIGYGRSLFYRSDAELTQDRRIVRIRDGFALACAAMPLAAIGLAYWSASGMVLDGRRLVGLEVAEHALPLMQLCATSEAEVPAQLLRTSILWGVASVLVIAGIWLLSKIERLRRNWTKFGWRPTRTQPHWILTFIAVVVLVLPIPLINLASDANEEFFNVLGPLATLGLVFMSLAWLLFYLGEKSKKWGVPIFSLIAIFVFGVGLYVWITSPSLKDVLASGTTKPSKEAPGLVAEFEAWLNARADAHKRAVGGDGAVHRPYPVYILAAPGGGIYAASFVASVMSRLESDCPGFSQHVFAISAVSGGAIGSSIINAITQRAKQVPEVKCYAREAQGNTQAVLVKAMLSDDHLSPTMASTVPDVIVKLAMIAFYEVQRLVGIRPNLIDIDGRAEALEDSLTVAARRACSRVKNSDKIALCTDNDEGGPLTRLFEKSWSPDGVAPALMLNTTWAETGERVAYSPFPLAGIGDGTLKAMSELPGGKSERLIEAAIASARFPAVLPAKIHRPEGRLWWNFVDGGYADASGTTTALEIYKAIEQKQAEIEKNTQTPIDLKLLLLTESSTDPGLPSGAGLSHAISPITTLLTIRDQIGRRAVARVRSDLKPSTPVPDTEEALAQDCNKRGERSRMYPILLDSSTIRLPLGWMLSRHTADMIDHLVNFPQNVRYAENTPGGTVAKENAATFLAIKESLTGKCGQDINSPRPTH